MFMAEQWDLVVVHENVLVAAFELKALGGPSYGNNYNNRVEEALGSAVDLRRAALAELYPKEKPWLGYFFIMQDGEGSRRPVKTAKGALPADEIWHGTSYQDRFGIFCERLMTEQFYDAACYVTSRHVTSRQCDAMRCDERTAKQQPSPVRP